MQAAVDQRTMRRVVGASAAGTVIEWYDFALYGAASALVINRLFFPDAGPVIGVLAAFATFAVGFFVRPLGGLVVSNYGDKIGRKPTLIFTVALMGLSTMLIGALPTYETVGVLAPVLLVLLRLAQGFGAGAEYAGALTLVAEYAPQQRRGFYTSISQAATALGLALAVGTFAALSVLPEEQLLAWGWRLPFLFSFVIFFVALFIRRRLSETPAFVQEQEQEQAQGEVPTRLPISQLFSERRRDAFLAFVSITGHNANVYVLNTFALSYITATLGLPQSVALLSLLVAAGVGVVTVPLFGALSDRIGRRPVFMGGAIFAALFAFPFFWLLGTGATPAVVLAMVLGYGVSFGAMAGAQGAFLSELFETRYRYTGIATAREMNAVIVAGPTPFIASALVAVAGGAPWLVAVYLIVCQALTVVAVGLLGETRTAMESPPQPSREEAAAGRGNE